MSFKHRIIVALVIMIVLPCVLVGGLGGISYRLQMRELNDVLKPDYSVIEVLSEPVKVMEEITDEQFEELTNTIFNYPERFENTEWLRNIDSELKHRYSFLVLFIDGNVSYVGDTVLYSALETDIRHIADCGGEYDGSVYINGDQQVLIKHRPFAMADGRHGIFVIVTELNDILSEIKTYVIRTVLFAIIAISLTAIVLVVWLYSGILKPIHALKLAVKEIERGNLNYTLDRGSNDEVGELCDNFDEMRRHIKTQIDAREKSEKEFREMISNVSHDLKTPLTAIKGYAEGIIDGVAATPEKQQKYLRSIIAKANDMTSLVSELSLYSKLDSGGLEYRYERVNANQYFKDCATEYADSYDPEDVCIEFESDLPFDTLVRIDTEQIKRVMNNLVGNSVKYRREDIQAHVIIKLMDAGDSVRVFVNDNGIGISKQSLPYIFDRFFRSDRARTSGKAGTGLGLAIVDKIVEEHGGRVFARSEVGKGTTISFTIQKGK